MSGEEKAKDEIAALHSHSFVTLAMTDKNAHFDPSTSFRLRQGYVGSPNGS
jgi:hypothetical protein